jgi:hypothetical protein
MSQWVRQSIKQSTNEAPRVLLTSYLFTVEVGLILIWGIKSYVRLLGIVTLVCGNCHNPAAQRVVQRIRKFTLFWIPLFPVKRQTLLTCTFCGTVTALTKDQAATLTSQMSSADAETQAAAPVELPASEH